MILFGDGVAFVVVFLSAIALVFGIVLLKMDWNDKGGLFVTGIILTIFGIPFFIIGVLDQTEAHTTVMKQSQYEISKLDNMTCTQIKQWRLDITQNKLNATYYAIEHAEDIARVCK